MALLQIPNCSLHCSADDVLRGREGSIATLSVLTLVRLVPCLDVVVFFLAIDWLILECKDGYQRKKGH